MDQFMDMVWEQIEISLLNIVNFLDTLLSPLEKLGPGFVIFVLAFMVVCLSRFFAKIYVTKRYVELKKEFEHWQHLRQEALKHPDREKGKTLAKNIDQARLNKAYYDYFFEGFMKSLLTNILPILLSAAYITTIYTPDRLMERFGNKWVFTISLGASSRINFSSLFWFVVSLVLSFILYAAVKHMVKKSLKKGKQSG